MVLEDFPAPLSLLFGGYIVGAGYLAFSVYIKEGFHKIDSFDKFMVSLIFGFLGFTIISGMLKININLSDSSSIFDFLKASPIIFLLNVFISKILMEIWGVIYKRIPNSFFE